MPYNDNPTAKMGPYHMESAKQERKDLLKDNPVVRDMDSSRPWMSKHFQSTMGSALKAGHPSPMEAGHEGGESPMSKHDGKSFDDPGFMDTHFKSGKPRNEAPKMKMDGVSMKEMGDGPRMSAFHEEGETGKENEDEKPSQPQQMYHHIQKLTSAKPKKKAELRRVKLQELKRKED